MRTLDGNFLSLSDLTKQGQLDSRYIRYTLPPENQFSPGIKGNVSWDSKYFYVCVIGGEPNGLWLASPLVSQWER